MPVFFEDSPWRSSMAAPLPDPASDASYDQDRREGRRRRKQLIAFGLLGWIPLVAAFGLLSLFFSERVANIVAVLLGGGFALLITLRYSSWRCPRCHQFFFSGGPLGYSPSGVRLLSRECRHCGLKL
jgi:hypothetical protein